MTIDAVRRKSSRTSRRQLREEPEALPIGESDANIFNCPSCARPLAVGTSRCPGCSVRLISGVRATKAVGFMALGLTMGLLIAGSAIGIVTLVSSATTPEAIAAAPVDPVVTPSSAPLASAVAPAPVEAPGVPADALTALRQTTLVNQRLVADAARLEAAMAPTTPAAVDIARALRALSATAAFGDRIAPDVALWTDGTDVSAGLVSFYAAVGSTAREGLAWSLQNRAAYVEAGRAMLAVMDDLPTLDATARTLAATADLDLPSLTAASPAP